ncbi:hypothetical protein LWI28_003807 [Acer negundo]|uniref:Biogenesis of lysosome-related organelles complex 1 subunit 7 n=1 Tax=Acer negundo TaxID=4023 RepID=A0AAD5NGQ3_ACENE|nr:hypothetical protein LWI28_003807 [Acer negundo]
MDETQLDSTGERESSVCFETINNNSNENPPQESDMMMKSSDDALGKALSSTLSSVIKDFDSRAQNTLQSQDQLGSAIHRLTQELDQLLEDVPLPFIMQHAAKISGYMKRKPQKVRDNSISCHLSVYCEGFQLYV